MSPQSRSPSANQEEEQVQGYAESQPEDKNEVVDEQSDEEKTRTVQVEHLRSSSSLERVDVGDGLYQAETIEHII